MNGNMLSAAFVGFSWFTMFIVCVVVLVMIWTYADEIVQSWAPTRDHRRGLKRLLAKARWGLFLEGTFFFGCVGRILSFNIQPNTGHRYLGFETHNPLLHNLFAVFPHLSMGFALPAGLSSMALLAGIEELEKSLKKILKTDTTSLPDTL